MTTENVPIAAPVASVPVEPPGGFWQREGSHFPRPLSPFGRSLPGILGGGGLRAMFAEFGFLAEKIDFREIGGWVYQSMIPLAPDEVGPRVQRAVEAIRSDRAGQTMQRWYDEWRPELAQRIAELRAVDLPALDDQALDAHVGRVLDLIGVAVERHFLLNGAYVLMLAEFVFTARDLLGWDDRPALDALAGLSEQSSEPTRGLHELTVLAAGRPPLRALLAAIDEWTPEQLGRLDPEFADALDGYRQAYGCRALGYDAAESTVAETPTFVLGLIRDQLARGYDPAADVAALARKREETIAEARAVLDSQPPADRERFERTLRRAGQAYPVREDNEFYTVSAPIALARYAALEIGRRLAVRGQIAHRDDVFFLEVEEARAALRDGRDRRELVARRVHEQTWVEAHPGPAAYGDPPGPPPPLDALPDEARFVMQALFWMVQTVLAPEASARVQAAGPALRGIPASPGRYRGTVRVVRDEREFDKVQAGDVLVCPITSPVWSVLFPSIGALVTDTGGVLSHPAIIAREYRIPAVVATGSATRMLRDGQVVTVDGAEGLVEVQP